MLIEQRSDAGDVAGFDGGEKRSLPFDRLPDLSVWAGRTRSFLGCGRSPILCMIVGDIKRAVKMGYIPYSSPLDPGCAPEWGYTRANVLLVAGDGGRLCLAAAGLPPAHAQIEEAHAKLGLAPHPELLQHVGYMGLDRLGRDDKRFGDLGVGMTADG
jgi:hypothetical protein